MRGANPVSWTAPATGWLAARSEATITAGTARTCSWLRHPAAAAAALAPQPRLVAAAGRIKEIRVKLVILDGYTLNPGDNPWTEIGALGTLTVYDRTPVAQIMERAADADIVVTNKVPLSAETLQQLPELEVHCRHGHRL